MDDYVLSCCSAADLTEEHFKEKGIRYVCFHYELNGKKYLDDLGKTISPAEFYKAVQCGANTKTSPVTQEDFENYFEPFLKEGKDIFHICLSSGISEVLRFAMAARNKLEERYPQRKIFVLDSFGASSGYGLLMDRLAELKEEGGTIDEVYEWARENRLKVHHCFFSMDLSFYVKDDRLTKTAALVEEMLDIYPLYNLDAKGRLTPRGKIRTKKRVQAELIKCMEEHAQGGADYSEKCYISQSDCYEAAREVAALVEEKFPKLKGKVEINTVGTTVGSHTGRGTVALFFWGDERKE